MPVDNAGNSLGTARGLNITPNTQTFTDSVSSLDTNDYYRIILSGRSSFNMSLNGLSADANLQLIRDANSNGVVDSGEVIASSLNTGTTNESLIRSLNADTYYIRVYPGINGASTNYNLNVSAKADIPDFNSDGKVDLIWRNYATGANSVWYMNGSTRTGSASLPSTPDLNWKLVGTGDFNSDGKADLVWRNYATGANSVWYMNGTTRIGSASLASVSDFNWKLEGTGDFNSDGKVDLIWRNYATGANSVWYMNGATRIGSAAVTSVSDVNWKLAGTGDFNSDGKVDLIWRNYATGANSVWYMNGTTRIGSASFASVSDFNWKLEGTGDFNSDGKVDLVWRNYATGANSVWYMNGTTRTSSATLPSTTDLNWQMGSQDAILDLANNTLASARNITVGSSNSTYKDWVGSSDRNDYYKFTLSGSSNFNLALNGLGANANVQLLNSSGAVVQSSINAGTIAESIVNTLSAGTYYIRVYPDTAVASTNYNLSVSAAPIAPLDPGNTLSTAEGQTSGIFSRNQQVSSSDRDDFYRFTISQSGIFTANLTGLTGDADVRLIQDSNNNGAIDLGEVKAWQWERGTASESIRSFLNAGNYFLQVMSYNNQTANYNVATNFTAAASDEQRFSIELDFGNTLTPGTGSLSGLNQAAQDAIAQAVGFWEGVITHRSSLTEPGPLVINVTGLELNYSDGTPDTSTLAYAGPSLTSDGTNLIIPNAAATINTRNLDELNANPTYLRDIMIHEFGHVLGIGTLWEPTEFTWSDGTTFTVGKNLIDRTAGTYNSNTYAGWAYGELLGTYTQTAIALTTGVGGGSDYSHWHEQVFNTELMTPYAESPGTSMPLSQLTIASLRDIGWNVNYGAAQAYSLPNNPSSPFARPLSAQSSSTGSSLQIRCGCALHLASSGIGVIGSSSISQMIGVA